MKVYAKFRIDIDKEDESIYTQKAVNLMQKLGCKAEKLYSSMERYTFTVDIKEAVYRELVELKKEIDQVFQYDEDTEEDDDEVLEGKILKELRLDGLVNADEIVVEHLQHNLEGTSNYIPVSKTKSGALSKTSKALYPDEFLEFLDYTKKLEAKLKGKIADGEVQAEPYEMGGATGCDYCAYRAICGFDTRIEGYEYRRLEKYSKEDVLEKIHIAAQEER